jgi:hypothetical protein
MHLFDHLLYARREYGTGNLLLLGLHRAARRLSAAACVERLHVMRQPLASAASGTRRGTSIDVRVCSDGATANEPATAALFATFRRLPGELADRFEQGATCVYAVREGKLLGWLWFARGRFRDFEYPLEFVLPRDASGVWDFDVYVKPEARLGACFVRLWAVASDLMREHGARYSYSTVSAFNPVSLNSHRRLGAEIVGSLLVVRLGRFKLVRAPRFGATLRATWQRDFRVAVTLEPRTVGP